MPVNKQIYSSLTGVLGDGHLLSHAPLLRKMLLAGHVETVLAAVAHTLLQVGFRTGSVPQNAGVLTSDLESRAADGILRAAEQYHRSGNPLTTRYVTVDQLRVEMLTQWLTNFAPAIPAEVVIRGTLSDPEVQDRLTVVALKLRRELLVRGETTNDTFRMEIPFDDLEGICRGVATALLKAFENPNETNHELGHGEPLR